MNSANHHDNIIRPMGRTLFPRYDIIIICMFILPSIVYLIRIYTQSPSVYSTAASCDTVVTPVCFIIIIISSSRPHFLVNDISRGNVSVCVSPDAGQRNFNIIIII